MNNLYSLKLAMRYIEGSFADSSFLIYDRDEDLFTQEKTLTRDLQDKSRNSAVDIFTVVDGKFVQLAFDAPRWSTVGEDDD